MWRTIGHPKTVDLLQRALEKGALSHAYLLAGPAQVGKMTLALDLAMTLNCSSEKNRRPCGECVSCRKIAEGKHADVQTICLSDIQADDENKDKQVTVVGIDTIDDLLHSASLPPFEGKYRVYIIEEAGQLSLDAANRLLKTLEEPPAGVVFLLLTTNLRLIPATIASRCQCINLGHLKLREIEGLLMNLYRVDGEKARLLARLSQGCPGWAIRAAEDTDLLLKRQEKFDKMLAVVKSDYSDRFSFAAQLALQFGKKRETVYETLDSWTSWWRDILLVKTGCDNDIVNLDYSSGLGEMAGAYSLTEIKAAVEDIIEAERQLKLNANARLVLESLMLNLPKPAVMTKT